MRLNNSSFPNGFTHGVTIKGTPILNVHSRKVFWVDSNGAGNKNGSYKSPLQTLDAAVALCTANRGDIIMVKAGHSESLAADSAVDLDVAGVTVIGLGNGEDRPIFTFTTATAADFKIAAANVAIQNLVFKCNIASQAMMIEVTGDDAVIEKCEFREGSATGLNFITVGVADNDADRFYISGCKFHMPTAGNGDSAISIAKDMVGGRILDCEIYGDFDLAGIDVPAGGNAQVDLHIGNCIITNLLTGQHAIQINGTGSTGKIYDTYVQTDAQATSIDAGGLESFNVLFHIGTDQVSATPALPALDGSYNFIGADNANNAASTSSVAANENGSVLERLEQIQEATNIGTGTSMGANSSVVDAIGFNGVAAITGTAGMLRTGAGTTFTTTSNVTSSAIPNNTQTAGNFTGASSGGDLLVEEILVNTDGTGWATPTNIEITTDNVYGLTGAAAPMVLEPTASFGANATFKSSEGTTNKLPFVLESGKKLFIHGDDNAGTGGGIGKITVKYRRMADGATIAANNLT